MPVGDGPPLKAPRSPASRSQPCPKTAPARSMWRLLQQRRGSCHLLPRRERAVNIVRVMFYVKPAVARAFQLWRAGLLTRRRSCHNILRLSAKARCAETSGCLTPVPRSEAPPAPSVLLPYVAWPHSLIEEFVGGRLHDSFGLLSFAHGVRLRTSSTALALSGSYARKLRTFP